jgi:hypothetical protein
VTDSSLLDDEDKDCATSHTNTLISFSYPEGQLPQIKIGAVQSNDGNSSPMFDLLALSIKPRSKRQSDPVLIRYKFWQVQNGKTEAAYLDQVFHGVGHHAVTHVDFERYGFTIKNLTAVEITVMEDRKLDFAFCLDDIARLEVKCENCALLLSAWRRCSCAASIMWPMKQFGRESDKSVENVLM